MELVRFHLTFYLCTVHTIAPLYLIVMPLKTEMKKKEIEKFDSSLEFQEDKTHKKGNTRTHPHKQNLISFRTHIYKHEHTLSFSPAVKLFFAYFISFYSSCCFLSLTSIYINTILLIFFHVYSIVSRFTVIICHFRGDVTVAASYMDECKQTLDAQWM